MKYKKTKPKRSSQLLNKLKMDNVILKLIFGSEFQNIRSKISAVKVLPKYNSYKDASAKTYLINAS